MKIAQVISTPPFAWATGGPARVVFELSKELVTRGHEVTILTTDLYRPNQRYVCTENPDYIDGIQVFRFRYLSNWLAWKHKTFISPGLIRYLRNHLREYDIVHLQDLISVQAIVTAKYCKKYDIAYVLTTHGSIPWLNENNSINMIFNRFFGNKIINDASEVITLNKTEAEQCRKIGVDENKIETVPNGIDLSEYDNLPKRGEFRRKYSIRDDEKMILYMGRLHKSKGVGLLVKAFADLSKELNNVRLVLVGPDDGYLSTLERSTRELKLSDKVLFTGFVTNNIKMAAFVDADIFVTPTFSGFPVTFLEACACSTPIITTNNGNELDWIHDKVGYVVEYDKDQLQDAIIKILSDEKLKEKFGSRGKKLVREEFEWNKIVKKFEVIYETAIHLDKLKGNIK